MSPRLKRDPAIELARILGCLIVIGVHTALPHMVNGHVDNSRLYTKMVFADGVAVFWLIAGCFMFDSSDYRRVLSRTLRSVLVPLFLTSLVLFYLDGWLYDGMTIASSVCKPMSAYADILSSILRWQNFAPNAVQLWYLYAYALLMLCFPVLKPFVDYLDKKPLRQRWFMVTTLGLFVINDLALNELWGFSHHTIGAVIPAFVETIWGHIVYRHRDDLRRSRVSTVSVLAFCMLNAFRLFVQKERFRGGVQNNEIMFWFSSLGLACALCILLFCLSIMRDHGASQRNLFICRLASYTFPVYLVHITVRNVLYQYGLREALANTFPSGLGFVSDIAYSVSVVAIIFTMSLALSVLGRLAVRLTVTAVSRIWQRP